MTLAINDTAPDFEAETTEGKIRFHDWIGDKWVVLFSHPKDFTPVCTTELGYMAKIKSEFDKRGVKIIGLSVDPLTSHHSWASDIKEAQGFAPNYPMIADADFKVSKLYGMLQLTAKHKVATPVNWEARRGRDHRGFGQRLRRQEAISVGLGSAQALYPYRHGTEEVTAAGSPVTTPSLWPPNSLPFLLARKLL